MQKHVLENSDIKKFFIISGPSGVGKGTVIARMIQDNPEITKVTTHTTRPAREGEIDGKDKYFVSIESFKEMIARDEFLEYREVYGNWYGSSFSDIKKKLIDGKIVVMEVDVDGTQTIVQKYPEIVTIFIDAEDPQNIEERIRRRGKDAPEIITRRILRMQAERAQAGLYTHVIINKEGQIDSAARELYSIIKEHVSK